MHESFWIEAARDFALLVAGGLLTTLGAYLSYRWSERARARSRVEELQDERAHHDREVIEGVHEQALALYMSVRDQQKNGSSDVATIDQGEWLRLEASCHKLHDPEVRAAVVSGVATLRGLRTPFNEGLLDGTPIQAQSQVLFSTLQVLSALLRYEPAPETHLTQLRRIGDAVSAAWDQVISRGEANRL